MRGMKVFSAVMAALMFAGCGGDAGMAHQREDAGIPGCSHLPSGPIAKSSGPATEDRDRKSTRLNSSHIQKSRMPSSA